MAKNKKNRKIEETKKSFFGRKVSLSVNYDHNLEGYNILFNKSMEIISIDCLTNYTMVDIEIYFEYVYKDKILQNKKTVVQMPVADIDYQNDDLRVIFDKIFNKSLGRAIMLTFALGEDERIKVIEMIKDIDSKYNFKNRLDSILPIVEEKNKKLKL